MVNVVGDTRPEAPETFFVNLVSATNALLQAGSTQGKGTIQADDPPPIVYVDDDWEFLANGVDPDGAAGPATAIGYDAFDTIQEGVDAVASNGLVIVYTGTYLEQVDVPKSLTIIGDGAGLTVLQAPSTLVDDPDFTGQAAILTVTDAAVVDISGFTIARPGPMGAFAAIEYGVLVKGDADLTLTNSEVTDVRDEPFSGMQSGVGIRVGGQFASAVGHATIRNTTISGYQKGGIVVDGAGSTAAIEYNTITGVGDTQTIAQNGIQVSRGAVATITGNTIADHRYGVDSWAATGILIYQAGAGIVVSGNVVTNANVAIYVQEVSNIVIAANTITGSDTGIFTYLSDGAWISANHLSANTNGFYNYQSNAVVLQDNVITGNAEGVFLDEGDVTLRGNTVADNAIGIHVYVFAGSAGNSTGTIISNTITGNDTGIQLSDEVSGDSVVPQVAAQFNRIVGNVTAVNNTTGTTMQGQNNWWGNNAGPGSTGSNSVTGLVDFGPWLVLTLAATPSVIDSGSTSALTASLTQNSNGQDTSGQGSVPDGIPVTFASDLGNVTPPITTTTSGLASSSLFVTTSAQGIASATVDQQTVQVPTVSISNAEVTEGDSGTTQLIFTVTLAQASTQVITVTYEVVDGTATLADNDYQTPLTTTLVFQPGETTQQIDVNVVGDTRPENTETLFVNLVGVTNAFLQNSARQATGTILDNDNQASLVLAAGQISGIAGYSTGDVVVGAITDSNSAGTEGLTADIDWKDGNTSAAQLRLRPGQPGEPAVWDVIGEHTYAVAADYPFTILLFRDGQLIDQKDGNAHIIASPAQTIGGFVRSYDPERDHVVPLGEAMVTVGTGELRLEHALDFDRSPGTSVGLDPMLVYNSETVNVRPIVELTVPTNGQPARIEVILTWADRAAQAPVVFTPTRFDAADPYRLAVQVDAPVTDTAVYDWKAQIKIYYDGQDTPVTALATGRTPVVRDDTTHFALGARWGLIDELDVSNNEVLWITPGGDWRLFTRTGTVVATGDETFTSMAEDFGTLVRHADQSYTYTDKFQTRYLFNAAGDLTNIIDLHNLTTTYTHDPLSRALTKVETIDGGVTNLVYGDGSIQIFEPGAPMLELFVDAGSHNLTSIHDIDAISSTRTFGYEDGTHYLTRDQWAPLDAGFYYDPDTGLLLQVDRGLGTTYEVSAVSMAGLDSSLLWIHGGATVSQALGSVEDARNNPSYFVVDERSRLLEQRRPLSSTETIAEKFVRNAAGQVTRYTDPRGFVTSNTYDAFGDLRLVQNPDGGPVSRDYHAVFHTVTREDRTVFASDGVSVQTTTFEYNATGDLILTIDAEQNTTTQIWDQGLLRFMIDPRGNVTEFEYDGARRLHETRDADFKVTTFEYDARGNPFETVDALGRRTTTIHDARGQLLEVRDAAGGITSWTYNATGQTTGSIDALGVRMSYHYDQRGWKDQAVEAVGRDEERESTWEYDAAGNAIREVLNSASRHPDPRYNNATENTYRYDAANRRTGMTEAAHDASIRRDSTFRYDLASNLLSETHGISANPALAHVVTTSYAYDARNRRTQVYENWNNFFGTFTTYDRLTTTEYDTAGNVRSQTTGLASNPLLARPSRTDFEYDKLNRLVMMTEAANDPAVARAATMIYDAASNLLSETHGIAADTNYARRITTSYAYDVLNRRTHVIEGFNDAQLKRTTVTAYDAVGNVLSITAPRAYDNEATDPDFPRTVTTSFGYDALDRRDKIIEAFGDPQLQRTTTMLYDAVGNVVSETHPRKYDNDVGPFPQNDPVSVTTSYAYDALYRRTRVIEAFNTPDTRSTRMLYDSASNLIETVNARNVTTSFAYDALNRQRRVDEAVNEPEQRFAGMTFDAADNLVLTTTGQSASSLANYAFPVSATFRYDALNRIIETVEAVDEEAQRESHAVHDAAGNLLVQITGLTGNAATNHPTVSTFRYDALGRQFESREAVGTADARTSSIVHDANDNLLRTIDALGRVTSIAYDVHNRATDKIDAWDTLDERETSFRYDAADNVRAVTTGQESGGSVGRTGYDHAATTRFEYDVLNRQPRFATRWAARRRWRMTPQTYCCRRRGLAPDHPDPRYAFPVTTQFAYDFLGRRVRVTEALGIGGQQRTTRMHYDAADNLDQLNEPLTYDLNANGTPVTDIRTVQTNYVYDKLNRRRRRLKRSTRTCNATASRSTTPPATSVKSSTRAARSRRTPSTTSGDSAR